MNWIKKAPRSLRWIAVPVLLYTVTQTVMASLTSKDILHYGWDTWLVSTLTAISVLIFTAYLLINVPEKFACIAGSSGLPWMIYGACSLLNMLIRGQVLWLPLAGFEIAALASYFAPVVLGMGYIRNLRV